MLRRSLSYVFSPARHFLSTKLQTDARKGCTPPVGASVEGASGRPRRASQRNSTGIGAGVLSDGKRWRNGHRAEPDLRFGSEIGKGTRPTAIWFFGRLPAARRRAIRIPDRPPERVGCPILDLEWQSEGLRRPIRNPGRPPECARTPFWNSMARRPCSGGGPGFCNDRRPIVASNIRFRAARVVPPTGRFDSEWRR
jgi:hypothetical protein